MKKVSCVLMLGLLVFNGPFSYGAAQPVKVVATLSTFADLAKLIGGEYVTISTIAAANFNPHFIEPKPSDVLKVKRADVFIHAGLDFELWRGPLLDAAGNTWVFPGGSGELDLSTGVALLEVPTVPLSRLAGDIHLYGNPHYWLDPNNVIIMAKAIAAKFSQLDPAHAATFDVRMRAFTRQLYARMVHWQQQLGPFHGQELVGDHRAWPYLMHFLGLKMEAHLEPKPGIPPSPKHIAWVEQYIMKQHIPVIVRAAYFPAQTPQAVSRRTGATLVVLCQNVGELPACADYLAMLDYDVTQLVTALRHG